MSKQGDREGFIAAIAYRLAEIDGYDEESLFQLRWSGGTEPEPLGDYFSMDFLPKAEMLMTVIDSELEQLSFDKLSAEIHIAELEVQLAERDRVISEMLGDLAS